MLISPASLCLRSPPMLRACISAPEEANAICCKDSRHWTFSMHPHVPQASLVAQMANNPPAMWEAWVPSLGGEGPLEKWTATHANILAWRIPWTEEPGKIQFKGLPRVRHDFHFSLLLLGLAPEFYFHAENSPRAFRNFQKCHILFTSQPPKRLLCTALFKKRERL